MIRNTWPYAYYKIIKIRECNYTQILSAKILGEPVYYKIRNDNWRGAMINFIGTIPEMVNFVWMMVISSCRGRGNGSSEWEERKACGEVYTDIIPLPDSDCKK